MDADPARRSPLWLPVACAGFALFATAACPAALLAESIKLAEDKPQQRAFRTRNEMNVTGQIKIAAPNDKVMTLDSVAKASFQYIERRLESAGRDARRYRSLRRYEAAGSIVEKPEYHSLRLRPAAATIVAEGDAAGIEVYSPDGALTTAEVELLATPGDPLAMVALLPNREIEVGKTWRPDSWSMQMLTQVEAVLEEELTCKLESISSGAALITFEGTMDGAVTGASTEITVKGEMEFDIASNYVRRGRLTQHEIRSIGAVSPGLDVTAEVRWSRSPISIPDSVNEMVVERIPLDPPPESLLVAYDFPWQARFFHDRNWHLFHQTSDVALFRLVEQGELVAQCTFRPVDDAEPGKHASEEEFQRDIRQTLGESLTEIQNASEIKTNDGRFLYRVTAVGRMSGQDVTWIYYLCAAPSGQQMAAVFTLRTNALEQFDGRDVAMISGLQFLSRR